MRVDNDNAYTKNQCSLVIRVDGEEIEIPVTFGMTADEIRMIYPFLLPMLNDKVLNPAVQFIKANEQGLLSDLTDEEYRNELIKVTEQSKYWYEKPSAGLLDIAVRFAVDIKMKGIEDLDFIFNRSASYDPMKIKPLTEMEANTIMQKLRIDGTQKDLDAFAELGSEIIEKDSTPEEIEKHEEVREQKAELKENPFSNTDSSETTQDDTGFAGSTVSAVNTADVFKNIRHMDDDTNIYDDIKDKKVDESKYASKYDPNAKFDESELKDGRLTLFEEEDRIEDEKKASSSTSYSDPYYNSTTDYNNDSGSENIDYSDFNSSVYDENDGDEDYGGSSYDEGEPPDDDELNLSDFGGDDGEND